MFDLIYGSKVLEALADCWLTVLMAMLKARTSFDSDGIVVEYVLQQWLEVGYLN